MILNNYKKDFSKQTSKVNYSIVKDNYKNVIFKNEDNKILHINKKSTTEIIINADNKELFECFFE